jgi:hypothetical protein
MTPATGAMISITGTSIRTTTDIITTTSTPTGTMNDAAAAT